jgi:hypothetical protein
MPAITSDGPPKPSTSVSRRTFAGRGSPLIRAAVAASVDVELVATYPRSRALERRLKPWHKTGRFCPTCRAQRGGRAR